MTRLDDFADDVVKSGLIAQVTLERVRAAPSDPVRAGIGSPREFLRWMTHRVSPAKGGPGPGASRAMSRGYVSVARLAA